MAERLALLQPLRARGVRVVVVDGGSADASLSIASELADVALVGTPGRAAQMNAGAAACSAGTLLFLHADTTLPDNADRMILDAVSRGRRWGRFDVHIDSARPTLRLVETMMNLRSRWTRIATGDQAMFISSELFDAVGGFPELALMEDIVMSSRLKRHGPPACLRQRVSTSARRWEQHGVWRTIFLMWRLRAAFFLGADPARLALRYGYAPPRNH